MSNMTAIYDKMEHIFLLEKKMEYTCYYFFGTADDNVLFLRSYHRARTHIRACLVPFTKRKKIFEGILPI